MTGRDFVRAQVRLRDKYICQDCGARRTPESVRRHNSKMASLKGKVKMFDVHHLKGLCGQKSRGYDPVCDMQLVVTLCHQCHYNRHDRSDRLNNVCLEFTERNLKILKLREQEKRNFREIGQRFGITPERARQIYQRVIHKRVSTALV